MFLMFSHLRFRISFQNCHHLKPCNFLVIKSDIMPSLRQYMIVKFPLLTWYMRKKYLMFKCLLILFKLFLPFSCSRIVHLLS